MAAAWCGRDVAEEGARLIFEIWKTTYQFHLQRGDLFVACDRHAPADHLAAWGDPFICAWEAVAGPDGAKRYVEPGDTIRVSVDGVLI